tara:strand:- start:5188 stop:5730 length:543 start_codon:yes stop_codon:yes gene_type:complete
MLYLKKNIVSKVTLDDIAYDLQFEKGKQSFIYNPKEKNQYEDKNIRSAISKNLNIAEYFDYVNIITKLSYEFMPEYSDKLFVKELEYLKYGLTDHFAPHQDAVKDGNKSTARQLTTITMLTKTDDMVGGELILFDSNGAKYNTDLQVGETVVFHSFTFHQVLPITCGGREVLVSWLYNKK